MRKLLAARLGDPIRGRGQGKRVDVGHGLHGGDGRRRVIAVLPGRVLFDGVQLGLPEQQIVGSELRRADDRYRLVHELGIAHDPLESLHPAHGDSHDSVEVFDTQGARHELVLGLHHVADGEARKMHVGLRGAVRRRRRYAVAQGVHQDHKVFRGIHQLPGSDEAEQIFRRTRKPGGKQHGVRLRSVELTQRAIAELAVANHLPALEPEIAQRGELLVLRGQRRGAHKEESSDNRQMSHEGNPRYLWNHQAKQKEGYVEGVARQSSARLSTYKSIASRMFLRPSSTLSLCVWQPGNAGQKTWYPPWSSFSKMTVNR